MRPLPRNIEYRVVETDREIKEDGLHRGWERVREVHRIVTKNDSGRQIVTSDTVVSDDPAEFRKRNPKVTLIGEAHSVSVRDIQDFVANAAPEELEDLGITLAVEDTPVASDVEFPEHRGGPHWTLSNGDSFVGSREAAEAAEASIAQE